jgi:hypothetical protein
MGLTEASDYETTKFICERMDYENSLLVQRTSWIVASQAFLVSAFALCVIGTNGSGTNPHTDTLELMIKLLPWTSIVSLIAFYITISGGLLAMFHLQQIIRERRGDGWERLLVQTRALPRFAGLVAPVVVPAVFLLTWIVVVVALR